MPKKVRSTRKVAKVIERKLNLCDRYLFRKTFLDNDLISKLILFTDHMVTSSRFTLDSSVRESIESLKQQLLNHEFNNIYDYLEAILVLQDKDENIAQMLYQTIEEVFPEHICLKLDNLYERTSHFDM